jgi:glycosyltransferase involved in cell wall biosynthesis
MVGEFSLICPYYRSPEMLRQQMSNWERYPEGVKIIVVDDGSPEDALSVLREASQDLLKRVCLYRITVDVPWNRGGARNLGATVATTDWIVHIDIDHVLPPESAEQLLDYDASPKRWYRFPRFRIGKADETRRKDAIPDEDEFGRVKEHIDSFLITRDLFMRSPYDEDYSGCLGGGSPFLSRMAKLSAVQVLPEEIHLHVYTRHVVKDASVSTLSRDTSEYARRKQKKERSGNVKAVNPLRFPWIKQEIHVSESRG